MCNAEVIVICKAEIPDTTIHEVAYVTENLVNYIRTGTSVFRTFNSVFLSLFLSKDFFDSILLHGNLITIR